MRSFASKVPIVLAAILLAAVGALGALRLRDATGLGLAFDSAAVVAYVVWIIVESKLVSIREASLPDAPGDRGSCELYAVAQGTTAVTALLVPGSGPPIAVVASTGLLLMLVGIGIRLSAVVALGRQYSRRVRLLPHHRVVTSGPYRLVRHPAYLGTLLGHLGFVTVLGSLVAALIWAAVFVPMVVRRVLLEEPVLFELEGYADYARRRKRLVPLLW